MLANLNSRENLELMLSGNKYQYNDTLQIYFHEIPDEVIEKLVKVI